jgi:hypothetical protein
MDKHKIQCGLVALIFCAIAAAICVNAQAAPVFTVLGVGNDSCGKWIEAHNTNGTDAFMQDSWLGGYISAFNNYAPHSKGDVTKRTDMPGITAWMSNYCQKDPLALIDTAAQKLIDNLRHQPRF